MEKKLKRGYFKSINSDKKQVTGYVSTFEFDRDNDRFVKGSWDLKNYQENPVVLFGHDMSQLPIGKNISLTEDEKGLLAVTEFDQESELAMKIFSLMERKFLNAFSVGFMIKEWEMEPIGDGQKKGMAITAAELYEYSVVTVPANPGALIGRNLGDLVKEVCGEKAVELLQTKSMGERYLVLGEEPEKAAPPDFETALRSVIDLSKAAKGSGLTEAKRSLMVTAVATFNDILNAQNEDVSAEMIEQMKQTVIGFGNALKSVAPDQAVIIEKTISQIGKAVTA